MGREIPMVNPSIYGNKDCCLQMTRIHHCLPNLSEILGNIPQLKNFL